MAVIKAAREGAGLTQRQLAERMGVAQSLIGRLETGRRSLALTESLAVAEALRVDPAKLLGQIVAQLETADEAVATD